VYDTAVQRGGWSCSTVYCSWGYTARLGGPPREVLYTVALRAVHCGVGWQQLYDGGRVLIIRPCASALKSLKGEAHAHRAVAPLLVRVDYSIQLDVRPARVQHPATTPHPPRAQPHRADIDHSTAPPQLSHSS
jgi:hypothetical protein